MENLETLDIGKPHHIYHIQKYRKFKAPGFYGFWWFLIFFTNHVMMGGPQLVYLFSVPLSSPANSICTWAWHRLWHWSMLISHLSSLNTDYTDWSWLIILIYMIYINLAHVFWWFWWTWWIWLFSSLTFAANIRKLNTHSWQKLGSFVQLAWFQSQRSG